MAKVLDCGHEVSEFKVQSCYYIYFWINVFGKGIQPSNPSSYELNSITAVLL